MSVTAEARYEISVNGTTRQVRVKMAGGGKFSLSVDGGPDIPIDAFETGPDNLTMLVQGASWEAGVEHTDEGFVVSVLGIPHDVTVVDPKRKALRTSTGADAAVVRTQMPGRIVRVLVEAGQAVKKGDPVVVVEAMKMENELKSPGDGTVKRVCVSPGDLVAARAVLVELQ